MQIIKNREVVQTAWLPEQHALCSDSAERQILPLQAWLERMDSLGPNERPASLPGIILQPDEGLELLKKWLSEIPVVAINVENFSDGRIYSLAFELRQFCQYRGEIRAVGAIYDNLSMMEKCGFDAFVLQGDLSAEEAIAYFNEIKFDYSLR